MLKSRRLYKGYEFHDIKLYTQRYGPNEQQTLNIHDWYTWLNTSR